MGYRGMPESAKSLENNAKFCTVGAPAAVWQAFKEERVEENEKCCQEFWGDVEWYDKCMLWSCWRIRLERRFISQEEPRPYKSKTYVEETVQVPIP